VNGWSSFLRLSGVSPVFPCTVLPSCVLRLAQQSRLGAKQGNLFLLGPPKMVFPNNFGD